MSGRLGSLKTYLDTLPAAKKGEALARLRIAKRHLAKPRRAALDAEHRLSVSAWQDACAELNELPKIEDEATVKTAIATALDGRALRGPQINVSPPPQTLGRVVKKIRIEAARLRIGAVSVSSAPRIRVPKAVASAPVISANEEEWKRIIQRYDHDCAGADKFFRPPVWATFDEAEPTLDPFRKVRSHHLLHDLLALGWTAAELRGGALLVSYTAAPDKPLHFPTLADAVWLNGGTGNWHAHFLPAPDCENCGRSKPISKAKKLRGLPEVVHGRLPSSRATRVRPVMRSKR